MPPPAARRAISPALVLALVLVQAGLARAQDPDPLARLAWLAGSWAGDIDGLRMEEHWTAPAGGTMLGMHRDVRGERTVGFEYARIEVRDGRPVFLASPGGAPPTPFAAIEVGDRRVVFENPRHDFPQRVIYWRTGDLLHARIEGTQAGRTDSSEWAWRRSTLAEGR